MSYLARITENMPTALVFLVDQSGSMSEKTTWHGRQVTKAVAVSDAVNSMIEELVARTRRFGGFRHYYDIAVLGYSNSQVYSLLPTDGELMFLDPELLATHPVRVVTENRERELPGGKKVVTRMSRKVWVLPRAEWNTPMVAALGEAHRMLKEWCRIYKGKACYPPTVINITDGECSDGTPQAVRKAADRIKKLSTADGNVLLMNIHIDGGRGEPVLFPVSEDELPADRYARLLFEISSLMPALYREQIADMYDQQPERAVRGMAYNADMADLVNLMNVGTATGKLIL